MNALLQSKFGSLSVDDLKKFLTDHSGYPTSICRHDGDSLTVASLISEPDERRLHVAVGNPCRESLCHLFHVEGARMKYAPPWICCRRSRNGCRRRGLHPAGYCGSAR